MIEEGEGKWPAGRCSPGPVNALTVPRPIHTAPPSNPPVPQLRALPAELSALSGLRVLALAGNALEALPPGLALPALAALDVSYNQLRALPDDLGDALPALRRLYAAGNRIAGLPASLRRARAALEAVVLSENPLGALPPALAACARLAQLSLAACGLKGELGAQVGEMRALRCAALWVARAAGHV